MLNQLEGRVYDSTKKVAEAIPDVTYAELAGSSEGVMDDPAAFSAALLEFLR